MKFLETKYFKIEKCLDCSVPGYLIIFYKENALSLADLPGDALVELGHLLSKIHKVLNQIIKPEKIYTAMFGEGKSPFLHFHIFPRTVTILKQYLDEVGDKGLPINGPLLLAWAREKFKNSTNNESGLKINKDIQQALNN